MFIALVMGHQGNAILRQRNANASGLGLIGEDKVMRIGGEAFHGFRCTGVIITRGVVNP